MKRDIDLLRKQLLDIAKIANGDEHLSLAIGEYSHIEFHEHLRLLKEAGFIEAIEVSDSDDPDMTHVLPKRITWEGYEYIESIRDPELWRQTKAGANVVRSWSFDTLKKIGSGLIKKKIEEHTGIKLE